MSGICLIRRKLAVVKCVGCLLQPGPRSRPEVLPYVKGLKQAGYTCAEAKQAGYVEGLKQASYTCVEAKQSGYVKGLKQAGYTCADAAGFRHLELKQAGYGEECPKGGEHKWVRHPRMSHRTRAA